MVSITLDPPRGTRDFYPDDLRKEHWLFDNWRSTSKSFGFDEYDAPIMEHASLWDKKSGSDILNEMFTLEKEGTQYTLRPEMTPSVTRMMINSYKTIPMPARWFSVPQCWRYESTARGRKREFYQWNIDIFGAVPIKSEIEIFSVIVHFLESVRLTKNDVVIRVSDRRILEKILQNLEVPAEHFTKACNTIDKMPKLERDDIYKMFEEIGVDKKKVDTLYDVVAVKNLDDLDKYLPGEPVLEEFKKVLTICEFIGIRDWIEVDISVVRGLAYYTGMVFEGFFKNSELKRAILGGGRYDNLMATYGAEPLPAIGFGMGDVIIMDVLAEMKLVPECKKPLHYIIIPFNEDLAPAALLIGNDIRKNTRFIVETYINGKRLKNALDYANKVGAQNTVILLPDEWKNKQVIVKSMATGIQRVLELPEFYKELGFPPQKGEIPRRACAPAVSDALGLSDSDNDYYGSGR